MKRLITLLAVTAALAGCAPMRQFTQEAPASGEVRLYKESMRNLYSAARKGEITAADAFRIKMKLDESTFGLTPYKREAALYYITIAGRFDSGEITGDEMELLIAEKENEVAARAQYEQRAAEEEYRRDMAALGILSNGLGNAARIYQYRPPVTCSTFGDIPGPAGGGGGVLSTTCY